MLFLTQIIIISFTLFVSYETLEFNQEGFEILNQLNYEFENSLYLTKKCKDHVLNITNGIKQKENWAMRVFDSFGKPPSGILDGSFYWIGDYSECLSVVNKTIDFKTKYCTIVRPTDLSDPAYYARYVYGVCIPMTCSNDEVAELMNTIMEKLPEELKEFLPMSLDNITSKFVTCKLDKTFDSAAIAAIVIISLIVFIVLACTIVDVFSKIKKPSRIEPLIDEALSKKKDLLSAVSFYSNAKKLFDISKTDEQLACLHGIRVLSMIWVIIGHTFLNSFGAAAKINVQVSWISSIPSLFITNSFFAVDSFFLLSGLLTCYLFLKEIDNRSGKISAMLILKYYIHRYCRLSPPYFIMLLFSITLTKYLGNGPFFPDNGFEPDSCKTYWWSNLLYINSIVNDGKTQCFSTGWYLSDDMIFHWIIPIVLIPFALRMKRTAIFIAGVLWSMSIILTGVIINLNPDTEMGALGTQGLKFSFLVYTPPWTRINTFIIGVLLGYIIHGHKKGTISFSLTRVINTLDG